MPRIGEITHTGKVKINVCSSLRTVTQERQSAKIDSLLFSQKKVVLSYNHYIQYWHSSLILCKFDPVLGCKFEWRLYWFPHSACWRWCPRPKQRMLPVRLNVCSRICITILVLFLWLSNYCGGVTSHRCLCSIWGVVTPTVWHHCVLSIEKIGKSESWYTMLLPSVLFSSMQWKVADHECYYQNWQLNREYSG